ncbi:MAG: hypothetical protein IPJ69_10195 [Deltaproteobacteria bacterium]|nr:MAG: hypothetical protein IPJ69_10195 [Deltaproteobacteria bacterium]
MSKILFVLLISSLLFSSCFSVDRRGGIVGIKGRTFQSGLGSFEVGRLPEGWSNPQNKLKQVVYTHDGMQATIVTDALCGKKFEEAPLRRLALDLLEPMEKSKIKSEKEFVLDGRKAYQMVGEGAIDGICMEMGVRVLKKDFCVYDFVLFAPKKYFSQSQKDFENYVSGFRTR